MRRPAALVLLGGALLFVSGLAVGLGTALQPGQSLRVVAAELGLAGPHAVTEAERLLVWTIVWHYRLPRVLLLTVVGGGLAVVGATLQATFQNPLADPAILGISAGGALGAALAVNAGLADRTFLALPACAFVGALACALLVYGLARTRGQPSQAGLLLTGMAVGALAAAGMSAVLLYSAGYRLQEVLLYLMGGAEGRTWEHLFLATPPVLLGCAVLVGLHRPLDALMLGEEQAAAVGVAVPRLRLGFLVCCALVAGAAVSVCGNIAFVGLIVPHGLRLLVGPRAVRLLPASLLGGALFLVLCDLVARLLSRTVEIHLGIVTAFLGVPFFLYLLHRNAWGYP
jgi:iron complex transport system permease protein